MKRLELPTTLLYECTLLIGTGNLFSGPDGYLTLNFE